MGKACCSFLRHTISSWGAPREIFPQVSAGAVVGFCKISEDKKLSLLTHMEMWAAFALCLFLFSLCIQAPCSSSSSHGIHPLALVFAITDEKYYHGDFIKCKDGSKSFSRDRLNDNFCDCLDGTDEPGTSACPAGKFYCRNAGSTPRFLFSSHVNDDICDCCDGSDEYDGTVICPNTCVMGGNIVYQTRNYDSFGNSRKSKPVINSEDSTHKLRGLKALVWLQLGFVVVFVIFRLFCKRRARRRTR